MMTFQEQVMQAVDAVQKRHRYAPPYGKLIMMMEETGQDVLRVCINDDGTFDILDFTMPSLGNKHRKNIPQEDVPEWVMHAVSMLRIAKEGDLVKGVGFKVSDTLYFIAEKGG
jgi:hypothetical protein